MERVIFSNESRFSLQHQEDRIRVQWHRGEHALAACIRHRHTGPSFSMMVWDAFGYTSRSPLVRTDGTLNSALYIFGVTTRGSTLYSSRAKPYV
ncbi:transposable element Tcb1 transposase [Trichonephila clavipes]|uniref:Transposable element Tcb1 transposase n=1 Tax=Trichonephila clavipes TaxID=2585209 RepID=A0A8X6V639_TRICX|nr:transposable element Tcb1 transposase [Trichonephila clavipes]